MTFWLDAQLSPNLCSWFSSQFPSHLMIPLRDIGLRDASDTTIFFKARDEKAIVITKDSDFVQLVEYYGAPPQVVWLRVGNTSNDALIKILSDRMGDIFTLLDSGSDVIEVRDK